MGESLAHDKNMIDFSVGREQAYYVCVHNFFHGLVQITDFVTSESLNGPQTLIC